MTDQLKIDKTEDEETEKKEKRKILVRYRKIFFGCYPDIPGILWREQDLSIIW